MNTPQIKRLILRRLSCFSLIVVLCSFWSGFADVRGDTGFTDTHGDGNLLSGPGGVTWTNEGDRAWTESGGKVTPVTENKEGFLINSYPCKDSGTLEVAVENISLWESYGGIVFRWTSNSSFYCIYAQIQNPGTGWVKWLENQTPQYGSSIGTDVATGLTFSSPYTLKVELDEDTFTVYLNGSEIGSFIDNSHPSGQVGYCYDDGAWNAMNSFLEITWTESGLGPPKIITHPSDATKAVGESVTFTVVATGDPSITGYQWKKDGSPIGGATSDSYTIASVVFGDAGTYSVDVTNDRGTTPSNGAVLTVYEPALVTDDPDDVTTLVGTNASFTVTAGGTPPLSYQWEMHNASSWGNVGSDDPSYTLNNVQPSHDGYRFRCTVTGYNSSSDQSAEATLHVTSAASIVTEPVTPREIAIGDSVIFSVVAGGSPAPDYQWEKHNGSTWDPVGFNVDTFAIDPVSLADEGTFRVRVWNPYGADTSGSAYLLVYDSTMVITSHPANDTVLAGDTATFSITASGASLIYQWQIQPSGGSFSDIAGATSDILKYEASSGDDRAWFRCVVASGPMKDTSNVAVLTIGTIPSITSSFSSDTVIPVDGNLTLTGSAGAVPPPVYEWFFIYPGSAPVSKGTGAALPLTNVTKGDSGIFYFVASNSFGSTSSDSLFVHVLSPVSITADLPSSYNVIHGGAATFTFGVAGDDTIHYQWYENGSEMLGQTNGSLDINPVDSAVHDGNTYYCQVSNTYLGVTVGTVKSATCTLKVSNYYNPFKVKVERVGIHNTSQVRVKLWSDVDITNFPTAEPFPGVPWADSLWLMYRTNGYAPSPTEASVALFSTEAVKQAAPDSLESILTVGYLPTPHDSGFWFNYSVKWHNPDTLLQPYLQAGKVFMLDTTASPNPLVVNGSYIRRDTVKITIDSISKLNASTDSLVIVQSSKFDDFSQLLFNDTFSVPALIAGGAGYTYVRIDSVDNFPLPTLSGTDTVLCRWFTIGTNTAVSAKLMTDYVIGWPRPVYSGILTADSTFLGDQMHLEWSAPLAGVDSLRIWYNTAPLPVGHYDPNLPATQAFYQSVGVIIDTITGLSSKTTYYFGLQIFSDEMWSVFTNASSDTATTSEGNPYTLDNVISIDSTGFNSVRNSMLVYWHIDLSTVPNDMFYQSNYTFEPDSSLDTSIKPAAAWDSVGQENSVTEIVLYPEIYFDRVYTVGLWLRGYNPLQGGPTQPASPTDSSKAFVQVPPFTWQEVFFFPADTQVVYAVNEKIILKEITHFEHKDTLWSFDPGALPDGFVSVGSPSFEFGNKKPGVAPFILGLRYDTLPAGVAEPDLAMYRVINGEFFVLYGCEAKDSAVWRTITSDSMDYPFIVLADTLAPTITVSVYNDTIEKGSAIPTWFTVRDNAANAHWSFNYGKGNEAYVNTSEGYLSTSNDTANQILELIADSAISEQFGVRALILAEDGVRSDTKNVSRCVKSTTGESFSITGNEWVPLRTQTGLYEQSLETVFDRSVQEPDPWEYDIYQFRIYRWHNTDQSGDNAWLEYSDAVKGEFTFIPGRLIWCKSAEDERISFGSGVTTTLKEPYRVTLRPQNWTDITLPFKFPVMLRDVLEATAPYYDSLEVYHWNKDSTGYSAHDIYIFAFDDINNEADTLISYQKYDGYTVYNHYTCPVTLQIPPICLPLSKYSSPVKKKRMEKSADSWNISFNWKNTDAGGGSFYRRVRCGYTKGDGRTIFGSLPPSMSRIQVGVLDNSRKRACGWVLKRSLDKSGGTTFEISLGNNTKKSAGIEYYLDNLAVLPKGFFARVYDVKTGKYEECVADNVSTLSIRSNSSVRRILAVGPEGYFNSLFAALLPMKLLKVYPNPFNGLVKVHYRIPLGIKEVRLSLYNIQGRLLWRGVERKHTDAGEHVYYLNGGGAAVNSALSAGVYIIRLSAKNSSGKVLYGGEKRIICIK